MPSWLGARIRSSSWRAGAAAAGLLGGQAAALAVKVSGWPALDDMGWSLLGTAAIALLIAIALPAALVGRVSRSTPWLAYLLVAIAAIGLYLDPER